MDDEQYLGAAMWRAGEPPNWEWIHVTLNPKGGLHPILVEGRINEIGFSFLIDEYSGVDLAELLTTGMPVEGLDNTSIEGVSTFPATKKFSVDFYQGLVTGMLYACAGQKHSIGNRHEEEEDDESEGGRGPASSLY